MAKYRIELIVFFAGAIVMILELTGSRILAPFLGTSIYTWTSLIGVILGALALGYWQGGRLADRQPQRRTLFIILSAAALFIFVTSITHKQILGWSTNLNNLVFSSILSATILFGIPSFILGMISPYAIKLKLEALKKSGQTAGNLYALSTIGSIVGTFGAGFFLIPALGSTKILLLLAGALIILALLALEKISLLEIIIANALIILLVGAFIFIQRQTSNTIETQYSSLKIVKSIDQNTMRPTLAVMTGPLDQQSAVFTDGKNNDLVFTYTKFYRLANYFHPKPKKALMIGGGALTVARDFIERNPNATMDVAEIDPAMTKVAKEFFGYNDDPRINIIHSDGKKDY